MKNSSPKRLFPGNTADIIAVLGFILFMVRLFYSYQCAPLMYDEFQYLFRSNAFLSGTYFPYQPFGFYMNKMPLAYYLFGLAQAVLGYGIRSGRLFSLLCALLTIVAYWATARRSSGSWAGTIMVWAFTLNSALIIIYSQAISQALAACLLGWTLFFLFQKTATHKTISLTAFLTAAAILTRVNFFPLFFLVILFYAWTSGIKQALLSLAIMSAILGIVHIIFSPGIFQIWIDPLPEIVKNLIPIYQPISGLPAWNPQVEMISRLHSFWETVRVNFFSFAGSIFALLLWKRQNKHWLYHEKAGFSLGSFLLIMFLLHSWETLGKNRCVYCLNSYYAFWFGAMILFILMTASNWQRNGKFTTFLSSVAWLGLATGVGFSWTTDLGVGIMNWQVPRIKGLTLQSGTTKLYTMVHNKFGFSYDELRILLPTLIGFAAGILILGLVIIFWLIIRQNKISLSFLRLSTFSFLAVAFIFTPSIPLSGGLFAGRTDCDVLTPLDMASSQLSETLPPGSLIYWGSSEAPFILSYLPQYRLFPQQVDGVYSQRVGGNTQDLLRQGYWNEEAASLWWEQANAVLLYHKDYRDQLFNSLSPETWNELQPIEVDVCEDTNYYLDIFYEK